jgi:hypothetical protein
VLLNCNFQLDILRCSVPPHPDFSSFINGQPNIVELRWTIRSATMIHRSFSPFALSKLSVPSLVEDQELSPDGMSSRWHLDHVAEELLTRCAKITHLSLSFMPKSLRKQFTHGDDSFVYPFFLPSSLKMVEVPFKPRDVRPLSRLCPNLEIIASIAVYKQTHRVSALISYSKGGY